jgi:hypothetical protein
VCSEALSQEKVDAEVNTHPTQTARRLRFVPLGQTTTSVHLPAKLRRKETEMV